MAVFPSLETHLLHSFLCMLAVIVFWNCGNSRAASISGFPDDGWSDKTPISRVFFYGVHRLSSSKPEIDVADR